MWSAVQSVAARGLAIPVVLVLTRLIEPEDFGVVAVALALLAVAQLLLDQGLGTALIQRRDLSPGHCDAAFWVNVIAGVVLAGALMAGAGGLQGFFNMHDLATVVRIVAVALVLDALGLVPAALLMRNLDFKSLALRTTTAGLVGGIAAISAALLGAGLWALVIQQLVYSLTALVLVWALARWRPRGRPRWAYLRDLTPVGIPVFGTNVLVALYRRSDDLIVGKVLGAASLGFYTVAYRLLLVLNEAFLSALSRVTLPAFSKAQDDLARIRRGLLRATAASSTLAFPAFTLLAVLASEAVDLLFGNEWRDSGPVLAALAPAGIAHTLAFLYSDVLLAVGRAKLRLGLWAVRCSLHVVGFLVAVPWGITAVAASFTITAAMMLPIDLFFVRRVISLPLREYGRGVAPQLVGCLALAATVIVFRASLPEVQSVLTLVGGGALATLVYVGVVHGLAPGALADVRVLLGGRTAKIQES